MKKFLLLLVTLTIGFGLSIADTFVKVTSINDLQDGDEVLFVHSATSAYYYSTTTISSNTLGSVKVDKALSDQFDVSSSPKTFTAKSVSGEDDTFTFVTAENKYLTNSSSTSASTASSISTNAKFKLKVSDSSVVIESNVLSGSVYRQLCWYAGGNGWRFYAPSTTYVPAIIYKKITTTGESVSLSFPDESYTAYVGQSFEAPVLSCTPEDVASNIQFTSSNTAVATVDASTGAVEIVGVGETTITASFAGDETYKAASAEYTLKVIDPNAISTVLDTNFFNGSGGYSAYTAEDKDTGVKYTTVFFTNSNNMQFNPGNASGKGSGIAVTTITPDYIINKIDIKFFDANGKGVDVYKKDAAFDAQTKTTNIDINGATKVGQTVTSNATVYIDAPAFAIVPTGTVYVSSVTVYYTLPAAKVEISSELTSDNEMMVTLTCADSDSYIYYGFSEDNIDNAYTDPFTVEESCTIYAYAKKGDENGPITSAEIKVPYRSFKQVIDEVPNGESVTIVGNFSTLAPQYGNYLLLTDGSTNILVFGQTDKFAAGTAISKIEATVNYRSGLFRLYDATLTEGGDGATITPTPVSSLEEINFTDNLFDLIKIENCNISNKDGDNATISLGENSVALFNQFKLDFNNGIKYDITGFVWRNNDLLQICPTLIENGEYAETVKTPVVSPDKRELQVNDQVEISCATQGATIYYTVDGTIPDNTSTKYEGPFTVYGDVVVKAIAYYEGDDKIMLPSEIAEKSYHAADPYCNVITTDNHEGSSAYTKHTCTVDNVDYAMYGYHNDSQGIQMNNTITRFCYIVQIGDNEGLALDNITVDFNAEPNNKQMEIEVRGSNIPFDVSVGADYNMSKEQKSITSNGVVVGTITYINNKVDFPRDYNYFAFYPKANGAIYMDAITINYRDPQAMKAAPVIEDNFADNFVSDEYGSLMFSNIPDHEDWIAYYQINDGENDSEVREAVTGDEGNLHEGLVSATLHTVKIWYEHYYYGEKSTVYVFNHVTQPQFGNLVEDREAGKTTFSFGTIGEGVKVYFTLNGDYPEILDEDLAKVIRRAGVNESGNTYVIDSSDDLDQTHVVTSATPQVEIAHGIVTDKRDNYTLSAVAVHDNGTRSDATVNDQIPTSIKEVSAVNPSDNAVYDLMGRKVAAPVRGLYIQNGTKRFVR